MNDRSISCFSTEIALDPAMPTHAGGLGILAGDTVRSAADLKVPMVAVTLLYRKTGWAIGGLGDANHARPDRDECDAASHYEKLEQLVISLFYRDREGFIDVMRQSISLNGSFFNTQLMLQQYVLKACFE